MREFREKNPRAHRTHSDSGCFGISAIMIKWDEQAFSGSADLEPQITSLGDVSQ